MAISGINVGCYKLINNLAITTALTASVQNTVENLGGIATVTAYANFDYGSSGTTAVAKVQTSLDGGSTWLDIIEFDFTTADRKAYAEVVATGSKAVTTYAALSTEGVNDFLLGDRLRAIITTTGTYVATTLTLAVAVR